MTIQSKSPLLAYYRIRLKERLDQNWSHWFEEMTVTSSRGETILTGPVADQAALYGLLIRMRDLNLTLLSLERLYPDLANPQ